jgi:hypothetical protein
VADTDDPNSSDRSYQAPGPGDKIPDDLRQWLDDYRANPELRPYLASGGHTSNDAATNDDAPRYTQWTPPPSHDYNDAARQARSN